jgi:hypothetical protein
MVVCSSNEEGARPSLFVLSVSHVSNDELWKDVSGDQYLAN